MPTRSGWRNCSGAKAPCSTTWKPCWPTTASGPGPHEVRSRTRPTARSSSRCPECSPRCSARGGFPSGCGARSATISRTKSCRPTSITFVAKRGEDLTAPGDAAGLRRVAGTRASAYWTNSARNRSSRAFSGPWPSPSCATCSVQLLGDAEGGRLASRSPSGLEGDTTVAQNQLLYRVARGEASHAGVPRRLRPSHGRRNGIGRAALPRGPPPARFHACMPSRRSNRSPEEIHQEHARQRAEVEKELPALLARWGGSSFREPIDGQPPPDPATAGLSRIGQTLPDDGLRVDPCGDPGTGAALAIGPRGLLPPLGGTGAIRDSPRGTSGGRRPAAASAGSRSSGSTCPT